jgi:hypothetical protein
MIFVTRQILLDLGLINVVAQPPVTLVNSKAIVAKIYTYPSLEAMKSAQWFVDGTAGGLTIICEITPPYSSPQISQEDGYLIRLHVTSCLM